MRATGNRWHLEPASRTRGARRRAVGCRMAFIAPVVGNYAAMIEDVLGKIDYDEQGSGPTILFVPGSWATPSAWRGVIAALPGRFRIVTTSLLGYGDTAERRTGTDIFIECE